jgi:hypothetical protein
VCSEVRSESIQRETPAYFLDSPTREFAFHPLLEKATSVWLVACGHGDDLSDHAVFVRTTKSTSQFNTCKRAKTWSRDFR